MRYLITIGEDEQSAIAALVGTRYELVTLEQARNGKLAEIAGQEVLCWPVEDSEEMAKFAADLRLAGSLVKEILVTGASLHPDAMHEAGWDFERLKKHLADENLLRTVIDYGESQGEPSAGPAARPADSPPVSDAPGVAPSPNPPVAQALADGPAPAVSSRTGPSPEPSEFISEDLPDSADLALDSVQDVRRNAHRDADRAILAHDRQLTAAEAYRPYTTPQSAPNWPKTPADWWAEQLPVPEMQSKWLPPAIADYVMHESETMGTDPGIMGMFALGICAGATSDAIKVRVKPEDTHWFESARLWLAVSGNSGTGKSPCLRVIVRPLEQLEQRLMEKAAHDIARYAMDMEIYEQQRRNYVSETVKGAAGLQEPIKPERPCRNRLTVKNSTIEALHSVLEDQGERGILEIHDEWASAFTGANQYKSGGSDIQERLKLWDGGRHTIDRKGSLINIRNWSSSMVGGTQPEKIRTLIKRMGLSDDGSLQRINLYTARLANLDIERPTHHGHQEFTDIVERLYELQHEGPVVFGEEANIIRREFFIWCHEEKLKSAMGEALRSHVSKFPAFFARFCATFHAIESVAAHSAYIAPEISAKTARRVSELLRDCLYPHAVSFYNAVIETNSEVMLAVRKIAGKVLAKNWRTITPTTLSAGWSGWRKLPSWQRRAVLATLAEGGWIYSDDRRGYVEGVTITYQVNPALQATFPHYVEVEKTYLEEMATRRERMAGED